MRCTIFSIFVMLASSVCLTVYIHRKRPQEATLAKEANFEDIKNTVTRDFLSEVMENLARDQDDLEKMKKNIEELQTLAQTQQDEAAAKKHDADECQGEQKKTEDELASLQNEENNLKTEKEAWTKDIESLKQEVSQKSKVCDYIKDSEEGKKLCGKAEEPPKEGAPPEEKKAAPAEAPKTR